MYKKILLCCLCLSIMGLSACNNDKQQLDNISIVERDISFVSEGVSSENSKGAFDESSLVSNITSSESQTSKEVTSITGIESSSEFSKTVSTAVSKGEWAKYLVKDYNTEKCFTAEMCVTKVTTASDDKNYVSKIINDYNDNRDINVMTLQGSPEGTEFVVVNVKIRIPEDEDVQNYYGIPSPFMMSIENPPDVKCFSTSVGFHGKDFVAHKAGDSFNARLVYKMIKGYDDYCIKISYNPSYDSTEYKDLYLNIK